MTHPPEFDFDDSKPRSLEIPYSEFLSWRAAHPHAIVFTIIVKPSHYRVTWKPGEKPVNNSSNISVETTPPA